MEESTLETDPAPTIAPEAPRSGPTPYTLVFSAAAIGALVALGDLAPAPHDPDEHARWLRDVGARLRDRWRDEMRATPAPSQIDTAKAIEWIERCLVYDPFQRPKPRRVLEAVHRRPQQVVPALSINSETAESSIRFPEIDRPQRSETSLTVAIAAVLAIGTAACTLGAVLARLWTEPAAPAPIVVPVPVAAPPPAPPPVEEAPTLPARQPPTRVEAPVIAAPPPPAEDEPEPEDEPADERAPAPPPEAPAEASPPVPRSPRSDLRPPWPDQ